MKTIHIRFPKLNGKSYNQVAKENEIKLITKVEKLIQEQPLKKKDYSFKGGIVKKPKTFVLE